MSEEVDPVQAAAWEKRAPGWVARCLKCGYTQPFGKFGYRLHAAGQPRKLLLCERCRVQCWHIVEKKRET